jgi:hypothetical protein
MAETSYLWNNPGTGDSPAAPGYDQADLMDVIFRMLLNGTGNRGVLRDWCGLPGWTCELEINDGGGLSVTVGHGAAIVYGGFYEQPDNWTMGGLPPNSTVLVVVRRSWAAQTIRVAVISPPAIQNPGVTYDIPLAQVVTGAAAINNITDLREFCEYSTDLHDDVVQAVHIQDDAVTTAKLENQTRRLVCAAGMLRPDATNPPAWVSAGNPLRNYWQMANAVTDVVWCSFRVPADFTGANVTVYVWNWPISVAGGGSVQWGWDAQIAAPSAVLASSSGTLNVDNTGREVYGSFNYRDQLTTLAVSSGDIVHMEVMRNGAAGGDTLGWDVALDAIEIEYTADS